MTLQTIAPLLKQGRATKRGRKAKAKPVLFSRKTELYYMRELLAISSMCQAESDKVLAVIKNDSRFIGDSLWQTVTGGSKSALFIRIDGISGRLAGTVVRAQRDATDGQLVRQIKQITAVDISSIVSSNALTDAVDDAITANVSLIKSIPKTYFDKLDGIINAGFQDGLTYNQIAEQLAKLDDVTDNRARLIARDQIGKLNGRFNQVRQQSLGIDSYEWSSSEDERVRSKHRQYDGKTYTWDNPPSDGHPGQAIQCRCTPIPNFDNILDD
jgi:SPP1 gp7 family putative phage head morphogenesis protein